MRVQRYLFIVFCEKAFYLFVYAVDHNNWRFYFAIFIATASICIWIFLTGFDVHFWSDPLAGYLYQPKFARRQNFVLCPIVLHLVTKVVVELFSVIGVCQINKIHNNNSSHIAQP